jgi:hypothetical protein
MGSESKLAARLARPPETWVDAVMVAVLTEPYFYGSLAAGVFLALAVVALVATRVLIAEIDRDERRKLKARRKQEAAAAETSGGREAKKDQ